LCRERTIIVCCDLKIYFQNIISIWTAAISKNKSWPNSESC